MSLKTLHIIFIISAILLAFGFAAWGLNQFRLEGSFDYLLMGVFSLAGGMALVVYGVRFLQKLKHIGYL